MIKDKILRNLCIHDKRNPDGKELHLFDEDFELKDKRDKKCSCDNCFYGRLELAEEILKLLSERE